MLSNCQRGLFGSRFLPILRSGEADTLSAYIIIIIIMTNKARRTRTREHAGLVGLSVSWLNCSKYFECRGGTTKKQWPLVVSENRQTLRNCDSTQKMLRFSSAPSSASPTSTRLCAPLLVWHHHPPHSASRHFLVSIFSLFYSRASGTTFALSQPWTHHPDLRTGHNIRVLCWRKLKRPSQATPHHPPCYCAFYNYALHDVIMALKVCCFCIGKDFHLLLLLFILSLYSQQQK